MKSYLRKVFYDYEKEEAWLNSMAAKGMAMTDYTWLRYTFEDCTPGEYIYRIEYIEHKANHPETHRYIRFMEESGVEHITTFQTGLWTWVYFRKRAADGPFEIYSDMESRIKHYRRISNVWLAVGFAQVFLSFGQMPGVLSYIRGENQYGLVSLAVSMLVLLAAGLFFGLWRRYAKKIKRLKREREIHE